MRVFCGKQLSKYVVNKLDDLKSEGVNKSRFCKNNLLNFLNSNDTKICGIFGLRRTGKTTLMLQTINELGFDNAVYILCTNSDNYIDVERVIDKLDQKYIFIDEITKADNFMLLASSLADIYAKKRIVITGTDSASLLFTKEAELYDRMTLIHTTYISFAEYHYLFDKSFEDYIKYGGTLTDGKKIYNDDEIEEYSNTAIVTNICKTVEKARGESNYKRLYSLFLSGDLEPAINKALEINTKIFALRILTSEFTKSHAFGTAKELMLKNRMELDEEDVDAIAEWKDHSEICKYVSEKINMSSSQNIKQDDIELITNFLVKLDVLDKVENDEVMFTQTGMQYCFAEVLIESIVNTTEYQKLFLNTQQLFLDKINQDAIGKIAENVIRTDVTRSPYLSEMKIGKYDGDGLGKFDLYIINPSSKKAVVYEIKKNYNVHPRQMQHLINENFCKKFENDFDCKIVEKAVIYQGENIQTEEGVFYYSVCNYLTNLDKVKSLLMETREIANNATNNNKLTWEQHFD